MNSSLNGNYIRFIWVNWFGGANIVYIYFIAFWFYMFVQRPVQKATGLLFKSKYMSQVEKVEILYAAGGKSSVPISYL